MTEEHSTPPADEQVGKHIHLPSRRRSSPWRLAVLRGSPVADDEFGREVATGFGSTKVGGGCTQVGTGTIFVTGGAATVSLSDHAQGAAILTETSLTAVDQEVTVFLASGAPSAQAGVAMRSNDDSLYAALVGFFAGEASVSVVSVVDGTWTTIAGPIELPEVDLTKPIRIRADSTGFDPTTIRVRAWNDGQPEPGQWEINIVDWASHMQTAGSIGLAWQISDERRAVVTLDDYAAQSSG